MQGGVGVNGWLVSLLALLILVSCKLSNSMSQSENVKELDGI